MATCGGKVKCGVVSLLVFVFIVGVALAVSGGILYGHFGRLERRIETRNVLRNNTGSDVHVSWSNVTFVYRNFYVFDVQNADDIIANRSKPIVRERGPYTYRVWLKKSEIEFGDGEKSVSYKLAKRVEFVANMSNGTELDVVIVPNVPVIALATWARFEEKSMQLCLGALLAVLHENLFTNLTVNELLWGYESPSWTNQWIRTFMRTYLNINVPGDSTFGLLYESGRSRDRALSEDTYDIWTGVGDVSRVRDVIRWNGQRSMSIWPPTGNMSISDQCNMLNGTDGSVWSPRVVQSTGPLYVFDPLWCRSMYFARNATDPDEDFAVGGSSRKMKVRKFEQPDAVYNNRLYNRGFCTGGQCMPNGVLNATLCRANSLPLMWSEPHFYQGDTAYLSTVGGLNPDADRHGSAVVVEPLTGSVVKSSRKLQFNVYIERLIGFGKTLHLKKNTVFPIAWMDEFFQMSSDDVAGLQTDLSWHDYYRRLELGFLIMMVVGIFVCLVVPLVACVLIARRSRHQGEKQPLLSKSSTSDSS